MHLLSFKLILCVIFLCVLRAHGGDDDKIKKIFRSPAADLKEKLGAMKFSAPLMASPEAEELDKKSVTDLGISVPPEYANDTIQYDHHTYYNSTTYSDPEVAKRFWINLNTYPETTVHEMLSNSHRQATTVDLKFDFPFYGSPLKNVTVATGGFLYMGDYLHNWIAATQYVAPLMANFDSSQSTDSLIKFADNGTAFTAEWDKVFIKDKMNEGSFTFQVTLLKNGDIIFAYKDIPYSIKNISNTSHPVKIGISDAYILERSLFFVRRKTIYEYHRIDMLEKSIGNDTALYFTALPTCLSYKNCTSCLAADPKMECIWCQSVNRCSDGVDRQRQSWIANGCSINVDQTCPLTVPTTTDKSMKQSTSPNAAVETSTVYHDKPSTSKQSSTYSIDVPSINNNAISPNNPQEAAQFTQESNTSTSNISVGAIITIVAFAVAMLGAVGWIGYAYRFPQTPSGQFLIKYRPSQWVLKKDDTSVTSSSRHL